MTEDNKKFMVMDGSSEGLDFIQNVCGSVGVRGVGMSVQILPVTVVFTNPAGEKIPSSYVIAEAVSKGAQMMSACNAALDQAGTMIKGKSNVMDMEAVHAIFRQAEANSPNNTRLTVLALEASAVIKQVCIATERWNYLYDLSVGSDSPISKEMQDRIRSGITFGILVGLQIARKDLKMNLEFPSNTPNEGINKYFGNMQAMREIYENPMDLALLLAAYKGE